MKLKRIAIAFSIVVMAMSARLPAEPTSGTELNLSQELRQLFQAEMRELLVGTQAIAVSIPAANWESIAASATAMRDSYVLDKKVTEAQERELDQLPAEFKSLDRAFHARAEKLLQAAKARDAEAVSFHFSRLLDTCVACHSSYARMQFPNFAPSDESHHH